MSKRRVHYYFALLLGKAHEDGRFLVANEDPNDIVQEWPGPTEKERSNAVDLFGRKWSVSYPDFADLSSPS